MKTPGKRTRAVAIVCASLSMIAACGSDDGDDSGGTSSDDTSGVVDTATTPIDDIDTDGIDMDGIDPDKVVLASILLAVGNVDVALADGLVSADEVDLAAEALASGTLSEWVDQAVTR